MTGKCGSVRVRLIPAPRGTGIVAGNASKKILLFAGFEDIFSSASGKTRTLGNFVKATYQACLKTYAFLTPDLWPDTSGKIGPIPYQEFSDELAKPREKAVSKEVQDIGAGEQQRGDQVQQQQQTPQDGHVHVAVGYGGQ